MRRYTLATTNSQKVATLIASVAAQDFTTVQVRAHWMGGDHVVITVDLDEYRAWAADEVDEEGVL